MVGATNELAELTSLRRELGEAERNVLDHAARVAELKARVRDRESEARRLEERVAKLEKLVDDLGTDPNPNSEEPEAVIKRHHTKAWEWARIANDACIDLGDVRAELTATKARFLAALEKAQEDAEAEQKRLTGLFDAEARAHGGTMYDLQMAKAECQAWREAHGTFGPHSPDEVAIFEQEARRVNAEIAEHEQQLRNALETRARKAEERLAALKGNVEPRSTG